MEYAGIHFASLEDGDNIQFAVNKDNLTIWARQSTNGVWGPWKQLDAGRDEYGRIYAYYADFAGKANTADKWTTARTITYIGDVSGSVLLDGSKNVSCTLKLTGDMSSAINAAVKSAIDAAMAAHVAKYHKMVDRGGGSN